MPINIAVRRAAKAQKRKAVVAEQRKTDALANSLAGKVRLAARSPIRHCFVTGGIFQSGAGMVALVRGVTPFQIEVATFLVDILSRGIHDVVFRSLNKAEFDEYMDAFFSIETMLEADPADARKLLRDLAAWSTALGFPPHPDYRKVEPLFGTVDAGASKMVFEFGLGGKPVFMGDGSDGKLHVGEFEIEMVLGDRLERIE